MCPTSWINVSNATPLSNASTLKVRISVHLEGMLRDGYATMRHNAHVNTSQKQLVTAKSQAFPHSFTLIFLKLTY